MDEDNLQNQIVDKLFNNNTEELNECEVDQEILTKHEKDFEDLQRVSNERKALIESAYLRYDNATEKSDNLREDIEERKTKLKNIYDKIASLEEKREEILQGALDNETLRITMLNCSQTSRRGKKKLSVALKQTEMIEAHKVLQHSFEQFQAGEMKIDITENQMKTVHARKRTNRRTENDSKVSLYDAGTSEPTSAVEVAEYRLKKARERESEALQKEDMLRRKLRETRRKIRTCQRQIRNTNREIKTRSLERH